MDASFDTDRFGLASWSKKRRAKMELDPEEATQMQVEKVERRLKNMLNPIEWQIMSFQSVLVWEKPYHSAAFLIAVNGLFWYVDVLVDALVS